LRSLWLGCVDYLDAWDIQRELAALHFDSEVEDRLLLLEHPPSITLGRGADRANVLGSPDALAARGIAVHDVDRGGDVTYHGPGQLVGYPIFNLSRHKKDLHWFLRQMEEALIQSLHKYDIHAGRFPPHTGVWVGDRKIAAMGIRVSRWVTTHGFALNVTASPEDFGYIVPCGIRDYTVTSIFLESGASPSLMEVGREAVKSFAAVFGHTSEIDDTVALSTLSEKSRKLLSNGIDMG
jgi:lipoyl(octanoyl) transferase